MSTASGRCCCWRHPGSLGTVPRGPQSPSGCILPPAMRQARGGTSIYMRIVNSVHHLPTRCVLRCRMGQHAQMTYVCMPSKCAKPDSHVLKSSSKTRCVQSRIRHPAFALSNVTYIMHGSCANVKCRIQNIRRSRIQDAACALLHVHRLLLGFLVSFP